MKFILSDGREVNSRGYKVAIGGINMDRFIRNPVMLKEHDPNVVIGRWENWTKENNQLSADSVFDMDDPIAKEVSRKVDRNFLRCASIGIIPLKLEYIDESYVMTESELVEASIVSIPSDAGAIRLYNDKLEELTFDQVKINFNFSNQNKKQTMEFKLSTKTMEILKLSGDYTPKDVEIAVAEKDREIEQLKADLAAITKKTQTDYLTQAVKAGKITEAERLAFDKMCERGCFDDVKSMIDAKTESASATLADKVHKSDLSAGRETWDYLKWMQADPKGLDKIRTENPKEFERLQLTLKK
ncbi:MAG: HK97 family phage prohead protease [Bacteroidales bacterium]